MSGNWATVKLGEIITRGNSGSTPRGGAEAYHGSGIPLIRSMNVHFHGFSAEGIVYLDEAQAAALNSAVVDAGDVLLNITGASIGRVTMAPYNMSGARVNQHVFRMTSRSLYSSNFLRYYLQSPEMQRIIGDDNYGVTRQALTKEMIVDFDLPLPPLPEQHRIVERIEALLAKGAKAKAALDALPALLDRYRQSLLAAAFRGDLTADWRRQRPSLALPLFKARKSSSKGARAEVSTASGQFFPCPSMWHQLPLGTLVRLQPGYAFKSSWFQNQGVKLLRGTNIVPGGTRWDEAVHLDPQQAADFGEFILSVGDIVIAMDRPFISSGLKVTRLTSSDLPALLLQRVGRFLLQPEIMTEYLWYYLHTDMFRIHIGKRATGSDLPHISGNDIETAPFFLPTLDEQREIVRLIEQRLVAVDALSRQVNELSSQHTTLTQSILAKAFRGELVPQDPADEPASVLLDRIRAERGAGTGTSRGRKRKAV